MTPADVNARGHARGWHAEMLAIAAARSGRTMAEQWRWDVQQSAAFSVPAECTRVTPCLVEYRFADGSVDTYRRPE